MPVNLRLTDIQHPAQVPYCAYKLFFGSLGGLGGFTRGGAHVTRTAALELRELARIFSSKLLVAAKARAVAVFGVERHEHTHGVALTRAGRGVALGTGHIAAIAAFLVVAVEAGNTLVCGMGKHNVHALGAGSFNFNGFLDGLRHLFDAAGLRAASPQKRQGKKSDDQGFHEQAPPEVVNLRKP